MLLQVILEGLGLGVLLMVICAIGIRNGAVNMVHFYSEKVQQRCVELGLTTKEKIKRKAIMLKVVCLPLYIAYLWICVYVLNGSQGFLTVFWQSFVIIFTMNLIDRFIIDELWVGHTKAWIIHGTEDLMPYIAKNDKCKKWIASIVSSIVISAVIGGIGILL